MIRSTLIAALINGYIRGGDIIEVGAAKGEIRAWGPSVLVVSLPFASCCKGTEIQSGEFGTEAADMHLTLEFGGGLELLFGSKKKHEVDVAPPDGLKEVTIESLLSWIKDNLIKERPEMFLKEKSVRPGVLVLVNDSDWELCGRLETVLEDNDEVIFISTLHGG